MKDYHYLPRIHSPADLRALPEEDLPALTKEIRDCIIETTLQNGGHLASNLGAVELTLALHRVLHTPEDRILFDVGHQCYTHKLITGRFSEFQTLRTPGGLSGFPKRGESEYDCFGTGHSSTSLSAALGFAEADRMAGRRRITAAVIGDGAFTGGMIHEALNNCKKDLPLIILLNENEMSISRNIGAFARHLANIRSTSGYYRTKRKTVHFLNRIPLIGEPVFKLIRSGKQAFKNALYGSNYFEALGLYYLGPIDGNDREKIEILLREAIASGQSAVIHLKTQKGKGFLPAEQAPDLFHSIKRGQFDQKGQPVSQTPSKDTFSPCLGRYLSEMADSDQTICTVTAAMTEGTGLTEFRQHHPDRFFDVGIAEEHALTFCAGLAAGGYHPFFAVYSSFLQRGYDNLFHDIMLQKLPVVICVDRCGLNAGDGATHHGIYDVSFLSSLGFPIAVPPTLAHLRMALMEAASSDTPRVIRYANVSDDPDVIAAFYPSMPSSLAFAQADYDDPGVKKRFILTYGRAASIALKAEQQLGSECGTILLERLSPYEQTAAAVAALLPSSPADLLFYEEGIEAGGAGMLLFDALRFLPVMQNKSYRVIALHQDIENKPLSFTGSPVDLIYGFETAFR